MATFLLPDLGEGLTEATILRWLVAPGDTVTLNQPVVEVETAKAAVEVPSPYAGVVAELHHAEGAEANVGQPLITITTADEPVTQADDSVTTADVPERTPVLVGYGPRTGSAARRPRKHAAAPVLAPVGKQPSLPEPPSVMEASPPPELRAPESPLPLAKPLVRKLARHLDVDLATVRATGPHGTISREDVEAAAGAAPAGADPTAGKLPGLPEPVRVLEGSPAPVAVIGVRKAMATAMTASALVPTATLFLTVDVTPTMQLIARLKAELDGIRINPLLMTARALLLGLRRHPAANASWTDGAITTHTQVNLGIAAATPRGLLVPNIKDAGALSLADLGRALGDLVQSARDGRTAPADMARGTVTITNIGSFGIDAGTPILNPGESVILALGTVRPTPWVLDDAIVVRQVCQLALSFDHRVLDGAQASGLLADVGRVLSDPDVVHAWV